MYTEKQRDELLVKIVDFMMAEPEFEGLIQIGSGAAGYRDIYSDIDLMAGCCGPAAVQTANRKLMTFFEELGAIYIDKRRWSSTVLGLSVYFENGLSADLSFMPVEEVVLRALVWKVLFSKSQAFKVCIQENASRLTPVQGRGVDDSVHHRFVYALRRCEIALCREEYIYADMALSEAREILLRVEAAREGKKLHQFKMFNTLETDFLKRLESTYPVIPDREALIAAKSAMLTLYIETVSKCEFLNFDRRQLKLLDVFA